MLRTARKRHSDLLQEAEDRLASQGIDEFIPLAEVAEHLQVSLRTVQRYVRAGDLDIVFMVPKNRRFVTRKSLASFLRGVPGTRKGERPWYAKTS